jgi:hypothetical protein
VLVNRPAINDKQETAIHNRQPSERYRRDYNVADDESSSSAENNINERVTSQFDQLQNHVNNFRQFKTSCHEMDAHRHSYTNPIC